MIFCLASVFGVLPSPVSLTVCRACELRFQAASSFDLCLHSIPHSCHGRAAWRVSWGQNNRKEKKKNTRPEDRVQLTDFFFHRKRTTAVFNIFINCCVQWMFTSSRVLVLCKLSDWYGLPGHFNELLVCSSWHGQSRCLLWDSFGV